MKKQIKLNVAIDEDLAKRLEEKRQNYSNKIGVDISMSSVIRKAIMYFLIEDVQ